MLVNRSTIGHRAILGVALLIGAFLARSDTLAENIGSNWPSRAIQMRSPTDRDKPPVVTAVSLQPGGSLLATCGDDHLVYIWDTTSDRLVQRLDGHEDWVHTLAFSPDGCTLATAGHDRRVIFWDVATGEQRSVVTDPRYAVTRLAWSHDGRLLAAIGFEHKVRIYDAIQRSLLRELDGPCSDLRSLAFSPDDRMIAVGGRDGVVRIWQTQDSQPIGDYKAHRQRIRALVFSPDGRQIVSAGEDRKLHVRALETGQGADLPQRPAKVFSLAFYGANHLAAGGSDNLIRLWDLSTGTEIGQLAEHKGSVATLSCDGNTLVSGSFDTTIRIWDIKGRIAAVPGQNQGRDRR